jgi:hypothetical protein
MRSTKAPLANRLITITPESQTAALKFMSAPTNPRAGPSRYGVQYSTCKDILWITGKSVISHLYGRVIDDCKMIDCMTEISYGH